MRKLTLLTLLMMAFAWNASAQDSTTVEAAEPKKGALSISGYADVYYQFALNRPFSGTTVGTGAGRVFDQEVDQFQLGLIQTKFNYSSDKIDIVGDLVYGPNAAYGNFGNSAVLGTPQIAAQIGESAIAIKQAYGTWKATEKLSFTAGQFGTHIGYEVIDAPVNFHYSLSNLFGNGPFYHLGAKANYVVSDKLALMAGVVNGWDGIYDNNKQKTIVGQVYLAPKDGWDVYVNFMTGREDLVNVNDNVTMFDLTTGYQVSDKFYLGLNAAYGMVTNPDTAFSNQYVAVTDAHGAKSSLDWFGVALYPNYKISDVVSIGLRYEYYEDIYGIRYHGTPGLTNNSLTLTAPITLADGAFTFKPEVRYDGATQKIYEGSTFSAEGTKTGSVAQNEQLTIGLSGIFTF